MTTILIVLAVLGLLTLAYTKMKSLFFTAKDESLTKEGEKLNSKQHQVMAELTELQTKLNTPSAEMSPKEIENYWDKK